MGFIKELCTWKNSFSISDCVTIIIAIFTLIVTISIPVQIMKFQRYTNLIAKYMDFDICNAVVGVVNFFHDVCNCDVERIEYEYLKRFKEDFNSYSKREIDKTDILHYQRRVLSAFYCELEMCRLSSWTLRRRIKKEWTANEAWIIKILIFMNDAVEKNQELFKDISCLKHEPTPKVKGISEYLRTLYDDLRRTKRWMQS